ncbi:MAG: response regulator transcription factor [Ignavibacteriaceae bacterium]
MKIKILVADDHSLVRTGINALIGSLPDMEIVGEADNGVDAVLKCKELNPDVVILGALLPFLSGIDAAGMIKKNNPEIVILVIAVKADEEFVFGALRSGASGVIYKDTSKEELVEAIKAIFRGNKYIGKNLAQLVLENLKYNERVSAGDNTPIGYMLTKREREVLVYIAEGLSNSEIGEKLAISPRTVDSHKTHLIQKLNLSSSAGLRKFAFEKMNIKEK